MKITILDGYTLNPGDLDWKVVHELGECKIYDRTPLNLVFERAKNSEIVLTNKTVIGKAVIEALPELKYIGVLATGYNVVDVKAAKEKNVVVTNIPSYGSESVAQMVFAHVLNLTQRVAYHAGTVRDGRWAVGDDFCYWDYPLIELKEKTMGIIGFGRIGRETSALARAFGMKVLAHDAYPPKELPEGVEMAELNDLLKRSDVVSLNCPLTADNEKMINHKRLAMMKSTAFLINTSRGPLVDEQALANALNEEIIAGAGLDVLTVEPPEKDNSLYKTKNCFITPHISWATREARQKLLYIAADNIKQFLIGNPINVIPQ